MDNQLITPLPDQTTEPREKDPIERLIELLAIDPATISFAASVAAFIAAISFHSAGAGALWCAIATVVTQFACLGLLALHRRSFLNRRWDDGHGRAGPCLTRQTSPDPVRESAADGRTGPEAGSGLRAGGRADGSVAARRSISRPAVPGRAIPAPCPTVQVPTRPSGR